MTDEVNHDDLWERTYTSEDRDSIKRVASDSLLATGKYRKTGSAAVVKRDTMIRYFPDGSSEEYARPSINVQASITDLKDPDQKRGVQFFTASPVRVNVMDRQTGADTGKPDRASQLWQQAYAIFKKVAERDPEGPAEIVDFLENQPYAVRVIQINTQDDARGEPRNVVVALSPLAEGG